MDDREFQLKPYADGVKKCVGCENMGDGMCGPIGKYLGQSNIEPICFLRIN